MKKKFIETVTIKALLLSSLLVIGVMTIILSIISSEQFKQAAIDSQQKTLARILEVSANEVIVQMHSKATDLGNNTKKPASFRKLTRKIFLSPSDSESKQSLITLLNDQFHQYYVTGGHLDLKKLRIYNIDFQLITESREGMNGLNSKLPDFLLNLAKPRSGADRLKAIGGLWVLNNEPLYSVLVPLGGLRLSGYMEVVVSPAHNLFSINKMLQAPLAIFDMNNNKLKETKNWGTTENDTSLTITFNLKDSLGKEVVQLKARENVEYLLNSVQDSQIFTIVAFIVLMITAVIIMLIILNHFLFKPIKTLINNMEYVANGDLTIKIDTHSLKDMHVLSIELSKLISGLRDQVSQISQTAEMIGESTN